jgi:hypothetical protein
VKVHGGQDGLIYGYARNTKVQINKETGKVKVYIAWRDILTFGETFTILGEIGAAFCYFAKKHRFASKEIVAKKSSLF